MIGISRVPNNGTFLNVTRKDGTPMNWRRVVSCDMSGLGDAILGRLNNLLLGLFDP